MSEIRVNGVPCVQMYVTFTQHQGKWSAFINEDKPSYGECWIITIPVPDKLWRAPQLPVKMDKVVEGK
jgi:hypothetical protein